MVWQVCAHACLILCCFCMLTFYFVNLAYLTSQSMSLTFIQEMYVPVCVCIGMSEGRGYSVFAHEMRASKNFQSRVRLECSQAADRINALNSLVSSEFVLIRTRGTLLAAELKCITSCHRESWTGTGTETDRNNQARLKG